MRGASIVNVEHKTHGALTIGLLLNVAQISVHMAKQEERLVDNGNLGAFYRYANNKFSIKPAIGALRRSNGAITNDSAIKAELLQSVFTDKFTLDNGTIPPSSASKARSELSNITFSSLLVHRAIKRLKIKT